MSISSISRVFRNLSLLTTLLVASTGAAHAQLRLEVDRQANELVAYDGEQELQRFVVSTGKEGNETPTGSFSINKVIWNPSWNPPAEKWARNKTPKGPADPDNPMKRVKMFFKEPDYYIHGTGDEENLGRAASHGCVRMSPEDVTALAKLVMEHGGKPMPEPWYKRILHYKTTKVVYLETPVPVEVRTGAERASSETAAAR